MQFFFSDFDSKQGKILSYFCTLVYYLLLFWSIVYESLSCRLKMYLMSNMFQCLAPTFHCLCQYFIDGTCWCFGVCVGVSVSGSHIILLIDVCVNCFSYLNINRLNLLELGFAVFLFFCGCYDYVHGKHNYFIYLFLQTLTFTIVGFGYVGTIV